MIGLLSSLVGGRGGRMLGGMIGGRTGAMVGGLAGSLIGGRQLGRLGRSLMNKGKSATNQGGQARAQSPAGEEDSITEDDAATLVRVMCNSAKADGHVDQTEAKKIAGELGDEVSDNERAFLEAELAGPLRSAQDMAREVPHSLRSEAYAVSLFAVDIDTPEEAAYLRDFAAALELSDDVIQSVHSELGVA